jgi:uncharacterized membrane protein
MEWIIRLLGAFYILGGFLLFRSARMEWLLNQAIEKITLKPEPDRWQVAFPVIAGLIYLLAGAALAALNAWGLWLLGAGLIAQGIYFPLAWYHADAEERRNTAQWRSARNAGIFSAAAFALSAYAYRVGVLA